VLAVLHREGAEWLGEGCEACLELACLGLCQELLELSDVQ